MDIKSYTTKIIEALNESSKILSKTLEETVVIGRGVSTGLDCNDVTCSGEYVDPCPTDTQCSTRTTSCPSNACATASCASRHTCGVLACGILSFDEGDQQCENVGCSGVYVHD